jgi:SAM-dependent methyltransferase
LCIGATTLSSSSDRIKRHLTQYDAAPLHAAVPPTCAACGATDLRPHLAVAGDAGPQGLIPTTDQYGRALADIVRCPACGHMQLERMPTDEELARAYEVAASEVYTEEEEGQRETARIALEQIERHTGGPGAMLDLGCWVGFLLAEARDRGWSTLGVEPSTFAANRARDRLGLEVVRGDLIEAQVPEGVWDAVVLGDVLEHVTMPCRALDRVSALLKPGGVVYIALPDAGSRVARILGPRWWSVLPTHVHYFTRGSLATLLRRRGFEPLVVRTAPKAFSISYYLDRIGGYSRPLANALVRGAQAAGVADRMWAPDFRDRMAVVARSGGPPPTGGR